jgi:hypothetical protein
VVGTSHNPAFGFFLSFFLSFFDFLKSLCLRVKRVQGEALRRSRSSHDEESCKAKGGSAARPFYDHIRRRGQRRSHGRSMHALGADPTGEPCACKIYLHASSCPLPSLLHAQWSFFGASRMAEWPVVRTLAKIGRYSWWEWRERRASPRTVCSGLLSRVRSFWMHACMRLDLGSLKDRAGG